jgi:transcriptional regulator with XRE-family HTH domain
MHYCMTSKIVSHAVRGGPPAAQYRAMPRKARPHPKPQRLRTYIKEWRKFRGLTLAQLSDRLAVEETVEISDGQLSRIERSQQPYSQDLLEAIARVLRCEPADLLMRDPTDPEALWSIYDQLTPAQRQQLAEFGQIIKRTGTAG